MRIRVKGLTTQRAITLFVLFLNTQKAVILLALLLASQSAITFCTCMYKENMFQHYLAFIALVLIEPTIYCLGDM